MIKNHATVYETHLNDVRIREIPGADYNTNIEATAAFNEQLEAFLVDILTSPRATSRPWERA